jgi:type I restriction enzyme R subunit
MTAVSNTTYPQGSSSRPLILRERDIEDAFIAKLVDLKYAYRPDICDRYSLEQNFRQKFEALNRVRLTDAEFARLHILETAVPAVIRAGCRDKYETVDSNK